MPITPATYDANGDVMNWTKVGAQIEAARTWLNGGVVAADIDTGAVQREHVVRPKFWGQPNDGMTGRVMQRYGYLENATSGAKRKPEDVCASRDRDSFHPYTLTPPDTEIWRTRFGSTIYVPRTSHVIVTCQGKVQIVNRNTWLYPDAETTGHIVGRLLIGIGDRSDLTAGLALFQESSHEMYPGISAGPPFHADEHFMCMTLTALNAGTYDLLLVYDRVSGGAPGVGDPLQFDIRTINWSIDVVPAVVP